MSSETVAGGNRQQHPTKHASWAARLTLMTCSTLLALAAVELTLRVQFASMPQVGLETLGHQTRFVQPRGEVRLGDLVRPSAHPGVVYELIPDISTTFQGKSLHVNQLGIPFVSGDADTRRYMKRNGIRKWPRSRLVIGAEDPHPSALWHDLLADTMLDQLESSGVIERMVARVGHDARR